MGDIFDKFNSNIDVKGLSSDVVESEKNGGSGNYPEIPDGTYEVSLTGLTTKNSGTFAPMEIVESKNGKPMVRMIFKIHGGQYNDQLIFLNQVIEQDFQIGIVNAILRSMQLETVESTEKALGGKLFMDFRQYNDLLSDCAEEIESSQLSFQLKYGTNNKGFKTYAIEDVFEG
jgi:hypothetical protein